MAPREQTTEKEQFTENELAHPFKKYYTIIDISYDPLTIEQVMAVYREKASSELNQDPEAPQMISAACKLLKKNQTRRGRLWSLRRGHPSLCPPRYILSCAWKWQSTFPFN